MSNSSPKTFPSKTSITPFWRSELDPLDEYRSTEKLPSSCDILIVGGGYAGIAAAYHLLCSEKYKDRKKPSVVLLEARQACSGATARNGYSLFKHNTGTYLRSFRWTFKAFGLQPSSSLH
jgi:monoamine oxidase